MDKLIEFVTNPLTIIFLAFIVVLGTLDTVQKLNRSRAWKQIGTEMGLNFTRQRSRNSPGQRLDGVFDGRALSLVESTYYRDTRYAKGRERKWYTKTTIHLQISCPPGTRLKFGRVVRIGSPVQTVTGVEAIDRGFDVESEPDWLARTVLASSEIQQKVLEMKMGDVVYAGESEIQFSATGRINQGNRLRSLVEFLSDLARAIESYQRT